MLESSKFRISMMDKELVKAGLKQLLDDLENPDCDSSQAEANMKKLGINSDEAIAIMDLFAHLMKIDLPYSDLMKDL